MSTALAFQSTTFDVIDRNNQPWIRSPQIAEAFGYKQANRITDLYNRNANEFTDSMTAVITLPTAGGPQETRIFSLRGCHLLAMFARTPVAKAFRVWALNVLEGLEKPAQKALPKGQSKKQKALPPPVDPVEAEVNALINKAEFYIREVDDIAKRVASLMASKTREKYPDITYRLSDPHGSFHLNSSCSTQFLWSSINFSLNAIRDTIKLRLQW